MKTVKVIIMRTRLIIVLLCLIAHTAGAQITTNPVFPSDTQPVEVIFNAQEGNGGLAGYTGDVYAHTGVITNLSSDPSDWQYVKTDWGVNTPETKLERMGTDLYRFTTGTQNIREYYNVPDTEDILQMAFVFRSATKVGSNYLQGKTETGGDIFANVFPPGLFVMITNPVEYANLTDPGEPIHVSAVANNADSIFLLVDNAMVLSLAGNILDYNLITETTGKHYIKLKVKYGELWAVDSAYYFIRKDVVEMPLPINIQDGINYINDSTVTLSLFAPGKNNVFILGDFNNWEFSDESFMYVTPDGSHFWKQINNLVPGKEYIFQYLVDENILIADPYADKVSDPWNDKYITNEVYPDLIPYPYTKTREIASVLQTGQTEYNWLYPAYTIPQKTDLVIYELLIRDFIAAHNYKVLIDTLNYLKKLGVNAIELMPVAEFEGNSSWGYNTSFHFAPDKYYGPENDLKQFIDVCHQKGFVVILDIVLNHVFGSSPFARLYWDAILNRPAVDNPWLNPVPRHNYNVGYDFNHESTATKYLVDRVVRYWINDYHIDGYRFDLSKGFTQTNTLNLDDYEWAKYDASRVAIWKNIANTIWSMDPDGYVILEHFAENLEEKELANYGMMLWGNLNTPFRQSVMAYVDNSDFTSLSYKARGWTHPNLIGYMESHDEQRLMYSINTWGNMHNPWYNIKNQDTAINRIAQASTFFYAVPGPKMLWQFGELGYDYDIQYNGRTGEKPVRWDYLDNFRREYLYKMTSALIKLKQEHDVFRTTDYTLSLSTLMKKMNLRSNEMSVTIMGNFDIQAGEIIPGFNVTGKWYEYFTGDSINVTSLTDKIYLKAGEYKLYTTKKLTVPETGLGLLDKQVYNNKVLGAVYPSPSHSQVYIPVNLPVGSEVSILLYDSLGQPVLRLYEGRLPAGKQIINAKLSNSIPGLHFIKLMTNHAIETAKVIVE